MKKIMIAQISPILGELNKNFIKHIEIINRAVEEKCDLVAGIGGGKTLDSAKAVANILGVPVIIIPTSASTDAPCSALSVIYTSDGNFKRYEFFNKNPDIVIVDSK